MLSRRQFLGGLSAGVLAAPVAAAAQPAALPTIGYLSSRSPGDSVHIVAAFRQGLNEAGFIEGQNGSSDTLNPLHPVTP